MELGTDMKKILASIFLLVGMSLNAANPSFQSFVPDQFETNGYQIRIKGSGLTNVPAAINSTNFWGRLSLTNTVHPGEAWCSPSGNDATATLGYGAFSTISNAVLSLTNNTTLRIFPGTNFVHCYTEMEIGGVVFDSLTNVTVIGDRGSILIPITATNYGDMFQLKKCYNLRFTGFTACGQTNGFIINATNYVGSVMGFLTSTGTNYWIEVDHCHFENWPDQVITHRGGWYSSVHHLFVHDNTMLNIGNNGVNFNVQGDGDFVSGLMANDCRITRNYANQIAKFVEWGFGAEVSTFTNRQWDLMEVSDNYITNCMTDFLVVVAPQQDTYYKSIIARNNVVYTSPSHNASEGIFQLWLQGNTLNIVEGNVFNDLFMGGIIIGSRRFNNEPCKVIYRNNISSAVGSAGINIRGKGSAASTNYTVYAEVINNRIRSSGSGYSAVSFGALNGKITGNTFEGSFPANSVLIEPMYGEINGAYYGTTNIVIADNIYNGTDNGSVYFVYSHVCTNILNLEFRNNQPRPGMALNRLIAPTAIATNVIVDQVFSGNPISGGLTATLGSIFRSSTDGQVYIATNAVPTAGGWKVGIALP